jgi:DNA ligase-associated metallophosphoesterase
VIQLGGLDLIPDLSGALYVPDFTTLIVADLHLEKASSLAGRGIALPPYDTRETIALLAASIAAHRPRRVIFLGDSFHDAEAPRRLVHDDLTGLRRAIGKAEPIWIAGNHDPNFTFDLGSAALSVALGPLTLRHEPQIELGEGEMEIAGHLHPVAAIVRRGRRIQQKCFAGNQVRVVVPAFGSLTGGLNVRAPAISELFPGGRFSVWMFGANGVHRFPAGRLA